jgi:epoxyqueuosine reductase
MTSDISAQIIEKAKEMGAIMAGIANLEPLEKSPSYEIQKKIGMGIEGVDSVLGVADLDEIKWPPKAKSALVIAVSHPQDEPELDWFDAYGGSPGNSALIRINRELAAWIEKARDIKTHKMPYHVEKGGIYLKDAAILSGLGCMGRNNMLITPELGPDLRLRALLLEAELTPTGPIAFDPCDGCKEPCRKACPQNAFEEVVIPPGEIGMASLPGRDGSFNRVKCITQIGIDVEDSGIAFDEMQISGLDADGKSQKADRIKYCRRCELACPVGRG